MSRVCVCERERERERERESEREKERMDRPPHKQTGEGYISSLGRGVLKRVL